MKLSILIATVKGREDLLMQLYKKIMNQVDSDIQVLISSDSKEVSIGVKRQSLLESACGDHICFIDDDDDIPDYYIQEILTAIKSEPDCVGFLIHCLINGIERMAVGSLKYTEWKDKTDGYDYVRSPYHKNPVRRVLALETGFKNLRYAEDHDYSKRLLPLLKSEIFINRVMYHYRYKTEPHNTKYGIK